MPVVRRSKALNLTEGQASINGGESSGNSKSPRETIQLRRSARLASKYKYVVPSEKLIVPSRKLLERQGLKTSFDTYKPVDPADLSKQPAWPEFETGPHGTRRLQREYSFVLADCGTHFEMVSPKTVNHFTRVPRCFGTMAPYHSFGPDIGEEELRRKLGAKVVTNEEDKGKTTAQKAASGSTSQKRKRGRSDDDDEEDRDVKRPVNKAKA